MREWTRVGIETTGWLALCAQKRFKLKCFLAVLTYKTGVNMGCLATSTARCNTCCCNKLRCCNTQMKMGDEAAAKTQNQVEKEDPDYKPPADA